ncbi:MAG: tRNA (adenosine(37)-N6)-threonylcarbamoyltransferase complex dimerization subunit type 1 TsaB [Oscillospiraceae bacterium]|jgi:tRNA threonylcarbamoyladenosine biosynthesis protein TsaB|nr:tRNA (adenosine(37)-N6)-threonylcarbamoyltransferase complex dimerization subunit type 1 TsaB [Oscillospiraceae bacterium]
MGLTLSIESSAKACSVALTDGRTLIAQYFLNSGLTHSQTLMAMIRDMLDTSNRAISDVSRVAVAHGPGSFTGVRIGIAAAKGLAWGGDIEVVGVSTLLAMASVFDTRDIVCAVMDARRGEVYNANFRCDGVVRLCDDRALTLDALIDEAASANTRYTLVGDGAELAHARFRERGVDVALAPDALRLQSAYGVAIASIGVEASGDVEPNYLRLSQAERAAAINS